MSGAETRPPVCYLSVLAVVATAVLSQLPALRSIKRRDVARVVRERAA